MFHSQVPATCTLVSRVHVEEIIEQYGNTLTPAGKGRWMMGDDVEQRKKMTEGLVNRAT